MKLFYWPCSQRNISQLFGENRACVDIATGSRYITCDGHKPPSGYKSVYGPQGHTGVDIPMPRWTNLYAMREGVVVEKVVDLARGLGLGILHGPYEGKYYVSRYWHLAALDVDLNEKVHTGSFLGYADNTGASSGDHLHLELWESDSVGNHVKPIDPLPLLFPTDAIKVSLLREAVEKLALVVDKLADLIRGR